MRCGEAIVRLLEQYGVDTVFGIPGVHTLEYYRGLAESTIKPVLSRHEGGAGFMADGYARATGKPGVCCVITGPGVTNVATPMGQAYSDSIPMLVLAAVNRTDTLGKGWGDLHESTDQLEIARPLAGMAATAYRPDDVPAFLARAFASFTASRPRPAYLEVPIDVLAAEVDGEWQAVHMCARPAPDGHAVDAALSCLRQAQRPAVIVGGGAAGSFEAVRRLTAALGAPVFSTIAGKGVVPADDPLALGATLPDPTAQAWLRERDVVLAIGTELAETDVWAREFPITGELIRVDIDPAQLAGRYPAAVPILADAGLFCEALLNRLAAEGAPTPLHAHGRQEAEQLRASLGGDGSDGVRVRVLRAIRAGLPAEARVYTDMTQIAYTGNGVFPVDQPRHWFHPSGFGTLGFALPAAIGGAIGDPSSPSVALVGDAGLLFTVGEMAVASDLTLPVTVILWNNEALGQIRDDMVRLDIPLTSVEGTNPDFSALAAAFGWQVERPASLDALESCLRGAGREGPLFVEVREESFVA